LENIFLSRGVVSTGGVLVAASLFALAGLYFFSFIFMICASFMSRLNLVIKLLQMLGSRYLFRINIVSYQMC
jgi:hypothetical protein